MHGSRLFACFVVETLTSISACFCKFWFLFLFFQQITLSISDVILLGSDEFSPHLHCIDLNFGENAVINLLVKCFLAWKMMEFMISCSVKASTVLTICHSTTLFFHHSVRLSRHFSNSHFQYHRHVKINQCSNTSDQLSCKLD